MPVRNKLRLNHCLLAAITKYYCGFPLGAHTLFLKPVDL